MGTAVAVLFRNYKKTIEDRLVVSEERHDECEKDREKQSKKIDRLKRDVDAALRAPCHLEECPRKKFLN